MSNKLQDIFSDKMFDLGAKFHFESIKAQKEFFEALRIVHDEGRAVKAEGVEAITTEVRDGEIIYPFLERVKVTDVTIFPPKKENVPFPLDTEYGEKTILFRRSHVAKETILETDEKEIAYFKFSHKEGTQQFTFTYRMQPYLANTIKDIVESYSAAIALLNKIFNHESVDSSSDECRFIDVRKSFKEAEAFFTRLYAIERELDLSFDPARLRDEESDQAKIDELYLLLIKKKVIRLNAKLTSTDETCIKMEKGAQTIEIGEKLALTFLNESKQKVYGQEFLIYTANLLSNAFVKKIEENEDGTTKVLYGDTDSEPMYISYTGHKLMKEAQKECNNIMGKKDEYTDALTLNEQINECRC